MAQGSPVSRAMATLSSARAHPSSPSMSPFPSQPDLRQSDAPPVARRLPELRLSSEELLALRVSPESAADAELHPAQIVRGLCPGARRVRGRRGQRKSSSQFCPSVKRARRNQNQPSAPARRSPLARLPRSRIHASAARRLSYSASMRSNQRFWSGPYSLGSACSANSGTRTARSPLRLSSSPLSASRSPAYSRIVSSIRKRGSAPAAAD